MKICSKCNANLGDEFFYKRALSKDGLYCYCKECSRGVRSSWSNNNRSRQKEILKRWAKKNVGKISAKKERWRKRNLEKVRELGRVYRSRRRSLLKSSLGNFTLKEFSALKIKLKNYCLCCGLSEGEIRLVPDHVVPISKGGDNSILNIQPLCDTCNKIKGAKHIDYRTKEIVLYGSV